MIRALFLSAFLSVFLCVPAAFAATYYVNYATGTDTNAGTSVAPWKHAPGDANATGNAKSVALKAGDTVQFAAGVTYYGSIAVPASGAVTQPITYEGTGWGKGQAVLSGYASAVLSFAREADNPTLSVATLTSGLAPGITSVVTIDGTVTYLANDSNSFDPLFPDEDANAYAASEMVGSGQNWTFTDSKLAAQLAQVPTSQIPNLIFRAYVASINNINMAVTGFNPGTGALSLSGPYVAPGTPFYTLYNNPNFIGSSNHYPEYAVQNGQIIAAVAPGAHTVAVSSLPYAIQIDYKSYVTVDGFTVQGYGANDGRAIQAFNGTGITITNNTLSQLAAPNLYSYSAIYARNIASLMIAANDVGSITYGAGIAASQSVNVAVSNNIIDATGWTGVVIYDDQDAAITNNRIMNLMGTHADGIIAYDVNTANWPQCQNVTIANNQITNGSIGIAVEGDLAKQAPSTTPDDFTIEYNVVTGEDQWAFGDWGMLNTALVTGNIFLVNAGAYGAWDISLSSINMSYVANIVSNFGTISSKSSALFTSITSLSAGTPPAGANNIVNTALSDELTNELVSPGSLTPDIGALLRPLPPPLQIGVDWTAP